MSPRVPSEKALKHGPTVPHWLRLLPIALFLLTLVFQAVSSDPAVVGITTAVVPLVASFILGPLWIAGMAAVVAAVVATPFIHIHTDSLDDRDLVAFAVVWSVGVGFAWVRTRYQSRLVTIESVAQAAQHAVLPTLPSRIGGLACAGLYRSAQRGARIGGDLFDLRASPFGIRMILGDVQGHGLPAVSTAAALLASFHEAILDEPDLECIAARLERRIVVDADEGHIPELFASVLLVEFGEDGEEIRLLSCGHPPPLVLRADRVEEVALETRPVLGLRLEPAERPPGAAAIPFRSDEILLAYSDGVSEARDAHGGFYPLEQHLKGLVPPASPQRLIDFVWDDLTRFADRLDDDVSLMAVAREGRGGAGRAGG
ncbi:MAG TPA: PP2C family protein-serine/threonine phosphatase [Glycomyces sp.]|nr:PP2C family protein-serine/threonine phosphatase [Glycomyces sp.]